MTVYDLIERLQSIDGNKIVLNMDGQGKWNSIELIEIENEVLMIKEIDLI
jgi:hypothetical protein